MSATSLAVLLGWCAFVACYSLARGARRLGLVMSEWEMEWYAPGTLPGLRCLVGNWVMARLRVAFAIWYCLTRERSEDIECYPWWAVLLYRVKAIVCLLLGRRDRECHGHRLSFVTLVAWNGRMDGYYEPEYEEDSLEVAEGFGGWRVRLRCYGDPWER